MERSMRLRHLLAATALFSSLMFRGAPAVAAEATATATAKVPVGVVLDLASHAAGRKSLAAIRESPHAGGPCTSGTHAEILPRQRLLVNLTFLFSIPEILAEN